MGDLAVDRQFKDLSITTSITLSAAGAMNQEGGHEDPSLPRDTMPLANPPLTPPAPAAGRNWTIEFNGPGRTCPPLIYLIPF